MLRAETGTVQQARAHDPRSQLQAEKRDYRSQGDADGIAMGAIAMASASGHLVHPPGVPD